MAQKKSPSEVVRGNRKGQAEVVTTNQKSQPVDWVTLLAAIPRTQTVMSMALTAMSTGKVILQTPCSICGRAK